MPSKRGIDQALIWLKSKTAEYDTMDAINAELCIHVIEDLKRQRDSLGALFQKANGDGKLTKRERLYYEKQLDMFDQVHP